MTQKELYDFKEKYPYVCVGTLVVSMRITVIPANVRHIENRPSVGLAYDFTIAKRNAWTVFD